MRLIIVSGLSGSGKSVALHMLEDLGYYCIDNIPAGVLGSLVSQITETGDATYDRTAVGVDARNRPTDIASAPELVQQLRHNGIQCEVLFLQAEDDILLKRYRETRRKHPLETARFGLREAINHERELLGPIINTADLIIDTTRTSVYELREAIESRVGQRGDSQLSILIQSFGFKHGIPADADFVFDVRCLPNPYWQPALRNHNGKQAAVIEYLEGQESVQRMCDSITGFLQECLPEYQSFNRSYLTVAVGCTGGQHRSVYIAEQLAGRLAPQYPKILTRHNELPG